MGLVVWSALAFVPAAFAQFNQYERDVDTAGLVIEAAAGWDGTVDRSTPVPISFLITNNSDRSIEGQLILTDTLNVQEVRLGDVFIGPGTTRRFATIRAMTDWYECVATLQDGQRILWRRELPLSTGKEFVANVNFILFVDDGGRRLVLPGALLDTTSLSNTEREVAGEDGRPIQCLTVKPWQVPNHPRPLDVAQAMLFPEDASDADLNRVQWRAVAEWMCQGGTVFVHHESRELIERLISAAPLSAEPPVASGEFVVHRIGLGAVYVYPQRLLTSEGGRIRQLIAETTAKLEENHLNTLIESVSFHGRWGRRARENRNLVVAFFGIYTVLSGVVALSLFRLSQRRMAAYIVTVVGIACVLSGLLGGHLRFSQGDLRWRSVTLAGAGGLVQVGRIDAQSAGGRNTQVAITGERADLQLIDDSRRYHRWHHQQSSYAPFSWQPNLANGEDDTYQIRVPMTPWGRRRLHATAFQRAWPRLDFELQFDPRDRPGDNEGRQTPFPRLPLGVFSLKLVNRLPFDLTDCMLVIGVTQESSDVASSMDDDLAMDGSFGMDTPMEAMVYGDPGQAGNATANGLTDSYYMFRLRDLSTGATYEDDFEAGFAGRRNIWNTAMPWSPGSRFPMRISRLGTASAWIIGEIESSPILAIDRQRSDFIPQDQLHLFVQEILPEDMPAASLFLGTADSAPHDVN